MKILFLQHGKTSDAHVQALEQLYYNRLRHYISFETGVLPDLKNTRSSSEKQIMQREGDQLLQQIDNSDWLVLLDEKGKEMDSPAFAQLLQKCMNQGLRRLVFAVGGPYGFAPEVHQRANEKLSLSRMTFSHQIIRCIFAEQLYRAFTILHNEPYHHA